MTLLGDKHTIQGFLELLDWGRNRYTVIAIPEELERDARECKTKRIAGELEGVAVNLGIARAPVMPTAFVWAGTALQRKIRCEAGDPVSGWLAPVDPDHVPLPGEIAEALEGAGRRKQWEVIPPSVRRKMLAEIEAAATEQTRTRRIEAMLRRL